MKQNKKEARQTINRSMLTYSLIVMLAVVGGFCLDTEEFSLFRSRENNDLQKCLSAKKVPNVGLADLAGIKYYFKYSSASSKEKVKFIDNLDGVAIKFEKTSDENMFNLTYKSVDKYLNVTSFVDQPFPKDMFDAYLKIVAYKPNEYAMLYTCINRDSVVIVERQLLTTSFNNNLDVPLTMDKALHFKSNFIQFPLTHPELLDLE